MRVVIEPDIAAHDAQLYSSDHTAPSIDGFDAVDASSLAFYAEQGYLLVRGGFNQAEVAAARQTLGDMCLQENPRCEAVYYEGMIRKHLAPSAGQSGVSGRAGASDTLAMGQVGDEVPRLPAELRARYVRKFMGFTRNHAALKALACHPGLIAAVSRLIGGPVREFQDMAMIKPPGGREKPWHQDHAYFNLPLDTRIVGVWIALDRVTTENGCMYLLAGAHRDGPRIHFMRRDWQICDTEIAGCTSVCAPMETGDVLLFDAKLPHGTPTNHSAGHRWAVQLHYVPQGVAEVDEQVRLGAFGSEGKNVTC